MVGSVWLTKLKDGLVVRVCHISDPSMTFKLTARIAPKVMIIWIIHFTALDGTI